jgi:soluble lytic murein transglycosylase-like protein
MKSTAFALFLGCSALVYGLAVQSNVPQTPEAKAVPALTAGLERLRLLFPLKGAMVQLPAPVLPKLPEPLQLSKAETLALISGAAAKYKVPAPFVISIVAAESNFNCAAVSPKGAIGLMQLMPETASEYGADPSIPAQNVDAGTHYLRWLMDRYRKRESSVIAAYNAGPGNVDRYHGVPPFRETRNYVTRVLKFIKQFSPAPLRVRNRWLMAREMQYFPR